MYGVFHVCIAMAALGYLNKTLNKFPLLSSCQVSTLYVFTQVSHKSCSWSLLVSNMEEWELWERIWFDFESRTRRTCSLIPIGTFSLQEVDVSTIMHGNRKSRDLILESRIIKLFVWRSWYDTLTSEYAQRQTIDFWFSFVTFETPRSSLLEAPS